MQTQFNFSGPSLTLVDQIKAWERRRAMIQALKRADENGDEVAHEWLRRWLVEDSRRVQQ